MRISDWSSDVCSSDLFFHIGVVEALWNEGVLPTILAGSSGGSIVAAIACTRRDRDIGAYLAGHRLANPDRDSGGGRIDPDKVADRRSEGRRVGKEGVSTWRSRWAPVP